MANPAMYISHPIPVKPSAKMRKGKIPRVPWKYRLQNRVRKSEAKRV